MKNLHLRPRASPTGLHCQSDLEAHCCWPCFGLCPVQVVEGAMSLRCCLVPDASHLPHARLCPASQQKLENLCRREFLRLAGNCRFPCKVCRELHSQLDFRDATSFMLRICAHHLTCLLTYGKEYYQTVSSTCKSSKKRPPAPPSRPLQFAQNLGREE